jgi:aminopeptidase-like protein
VNLDELKQHVYTLPNQPELIPYRTSYYNDWWGFCASDKLIRSLAPDSYEVHIDSTLEHGSLTYGECYIPGSSEEEFLLSCHVCHPSLCNDNLSGIALLTFLGHILKGQSDLRYSYRILFIPATIGSIAWLAKNEESVHLVKHGLVVTCVGDGGRFTYKKSRQGDAEIDRAAIYALQRSNRDCQIKEFFPYGYDERQYCSPGFDLPVGCLMRSPHGEYPEYHTSADNLDFVRAEYLQESLQQYMELIEIIESNVILVSTNMKCEPQLGKRGLYKLIAGDDGQGHQQLAMLWVLNLADGRHTLLDMADRAGMDFRMLKNIANDLIKAGLLKKH